MKHLLVTLTLLLVLCVPVLAQNGFGPQGNHRHHRFGRHLGATNAKAANRFQGNGVPGVQAQGFNRSARGNNIPGAQAQGFNRSARGNGAPGVQAQGFTRHAKFGKSAHRRHHQRSASAPNVGATTFRRSN